MSGWGQGASACGTLHLDIHPALQALVMEEVVAGRDHARPWLPHLSRVHADHTLTACTTSSTFTHPDQALHSLTQSYTALPVLDGLTQPHPVLTKPRMNLSSPTAHHPAVYTCLPSLTHPMQVLFRHITTCRPEVLD